MRYLVLILIAGFLLVITWIFWNWRFEIIPDRSAVLVNDGTGEGFHLGRKEGEKAPANSLDLPSEFTGEKLHIQFNYRAIQVVPGEKTWQVGRLILDWKDQNGNLAEHDTLMTMEGNDPEMRKKEMVVIGKSGLRPSLRIEQQGYSGSVEVKGMTIQVVRDRQGYQWFALVVMMTWGVWMFFLISMLSQKCLPRRFLVTFILLVMGWFLAVPGPWHHFMPLAGKFEIGAQPEHVVTLIMPIHESKTANTPEPLGEMPVQAGWLFRMKILLSYIRPVLHVLLFAVPAFLIAGLCGSKCAWWSLFLMAIAVEMAQVAFWMSFDWVDIADLILDVLGIALGVIFLEKFVSLGWARTMVSRK